MMSKYILGLTGGIGSGKTTVSDLFKAQGIVIVDADIIAREVVAPHSYALSQIAAYFGDDFIDAQGQLNRTKLREQIFQNPQDKSWLNGLLHPLIRQEIQNQLSDAHGPYCILVAPLLFENNLQKLTNRVLVVDISEAEQIKRVVARDPSNEAEIKRIIASQIKRDERLKLADDIIDNSSSDLSKLKQTVLQLHQQYLEHANKVR